MNDNQAKSKSSLMRVFKLFVVLVASLSIGFTGIATASIVGNPMTVQAGSSYDTMSRYDQERLRQLLSEHNNWISSGRYANELVSAGQMTQEEYDWLKDNTYPSGAGQRSLVPQGGAFSEGGGASFATVYADLIMGSEDRSIGEGESVAQAVDDGKIQFDIGYGYIATQGDAISGGSAGTQLATYIASANHYGYFSTVSGNSIARRAGSALVRVLNAIGGFIIKGSLVVMEFGRTLLTSVVELIALINPYDLLTAVTQDEASQQPNRLYLVVQQFFNNIGINDGLFKAIASVSLMVFSTIAGFQIMKALQSGITNNNAIDPIKKFFVRAITIAVVIPLSAQLLSSFASGMLEQADENPAPYVVPSYVIDTKMWAATTNLAPPSGVTLNGDPENNYIDDSFAPSIMRGNIAQINRESYMSSSQTDFNSSDAASLSHALLDEWMSRGTFSVNDYAHEIRKQASAQYPRIVALEYPGKNGGNAEVVVSREGPDGIDLGVIEGYIWSANPKLEDNNGPTSKSQAITVDGDTEKIKYNGGSTLGVTTTTDGRQTLSTQSVALLLQSGFENDKAVVYLENIPASGIYEKLKNLTSVATAWHTATLTGNGISGKMGSYADMLITSLLHAVLYIATIFALLGGPFLKGLVGAVRLLFETIIYGEPMLAVGGFVLAMGAGVTAVWSTFIPATVVGTIGDLAVAIISLVTNDVLVGSGLVEIIVALAHTS